MIFSLILIPFHYFAYNARKLFSQIVSFFVSLTLKLPLAKLMAHRNISVAHVSNLKLWPLLANNDKREIATPNIVVKCSPNYITIKRKILRISPFHFTAMLRRYGYSHFRSHFSLRITKRMLNTNVPVNSK